MKKAISILLFSSIILNAAPVVPDEYVICDGVAATYITPKNSQINTAKIARHQARIIKRYEQEYGYKLDQRLYLTLASQNNQIANGFSTQFPLNEQVFYGGGVGHYDYFSSTSWLKTLLIHETAHNFQLNPKENCISKFAHKISGNSMVINPFFIPLFPVPNITESSYILEGNAVLNESLWGNGGRLYSGYALAETVTQARAGNITPEKMYNGSYSFPGGEKSYLIGGHFQKFLARRYGLKKVNSYFKSYAKQPFPFFSNHVFREHYGKDFVTLMDEFQESVSAEHKGFRASRGDIIAKSQIAVPLERDGREVYTLVSNKLSAPKIWKLDTGSGSVSYRSGGWRTGRVVKESGRYYTQSSANTSPSQISMGLFDTDGYIKPSTASKVVQGRMRDGKEVYFDVARSWDQPHLYVDGRFYGAVNSSVFVHGNDLYYFKQSGERRYLYKNRTKLTSFKGHYGAITDVDDKGRVYFIAPSKHGSTAYRFGHGRLMRVADGDDVIGLKYTGSNNAIAQTVGKKGYTIKKIRLHPRVDRVAEYDMGLPHMSLGSVDGDNDGLDLPDLHSYSPLGELRFGSLNSSSAYDTENGYSFSMQARFADPLWQNTLAFALKYRRQRMLLSAAYSNSAHWLHFGGSITGVRKKAGYDNSGYREMGYSAYVSLPFLATGYWRGSATLTYSKPYHDTKREPLTFSTDIRYRQQFGYSKYPNSLFGLSGFVSHDRDATYAGLKLRWMEDISHQTYIEAKGAYLYSSKLDKTQSVGIKIGNTLSSHNDMAALNIPTMSNTKYVKQAVMAGVGVYKVFDYEWLNYHLPISLLRESIYLKHNIYNLQYESGKHKTIHESIAGVEGDMLMFHRGVVPVKLELLYNPDAKKRVQVRVRAEYRF